MKKALLIIYSIAHSRIKHTFNVYFIYIICALFVSLLHLSHLTNVFAVDFKRQGSVFEIKEMSFSQMMEAKVSSVDYEKYKSMMVSRVEKWLKRNDSKIPRCIESRTFMVDMSYVLNQDILDKDGNVIFEKGKSVNPLDTVTLDSNIVLIDANDEIQIKWYEKEYKDAKSTLILVGGNPIELSKRLNIDVYLDQLGEWVSKFKVESLPAVLSQSDRSIKVNEVRIEL